MYTRYLKDSGYEKNINVYDKRLAQIISNKYLKGEIVVDIGCAYGNLVEAFNQLGYRGIGIDNDNDAHVICNKKGIKFYKCDVDKEKLPLKTKSIDNITCFHVLEHLWDIQRFVKECHRVLKNSGVIVFLVPNWEKMYKNYWDNYTHVTPISKNRLKNLLDANGFKIIDMKGFKKPDWVKLIWRYFDFPFFMNWNFFLCVAEKKGD